MTNLPITGIFNITCEYRRKNGNGLKWAAGFHTGIDITSKDDTIYATCEGTVTRIGNDKSYGNFIVIKNGNDGNYHWFCHLSEIWVQKNDNVTRVTKIGRMGATGNVTGKHLHYEIRKQSNNYGDVISPADYMGIANKVANGLNSKDYDISKTENNKPDTINVGDIKKLKVRTNIREYPNLDGKAHLFIENTTVEIIETNVNNEDGYIWDKVKIVYASENDIKEGYVARTCKRYK